ncbi:hypothetical protein FLAN108750_09855 [Flavobacterium antarcticum]|uniref:hypothetical protein n=1 Tax=Flavobacterium antarcticum TaxID=271155 RepID=UPI0012F7C6FE|nr:hypothetical protein [Flavobacterium antarcticum]
MKKLYIIASLLFLALASCSSSDGDSSGPVSPFIPLNASSSWVYDVKLNGELIGRDSLYVSGENTINGTIYQKLKTKEVPNGFYTNALNNNNIRKSGDKLLISGSTGLGLAEFLPVNIEVNDFILFKENSIANAQLDAISGTAEQDLDGLPLKIDYTLKTFFKESLATFTVPGKETYSNVKVIKLITNLKVSTVYLIPVVNTPFPVSILNAQDVIISLQYYAEGVGMIYSKTDINYQLNDFSEFGIELPIPQQGSNSIEEFLD